jgi:predicted nucleic acid-binding protein
MIIAERLQSVRRLFLDRAPVIYYVEENTRYLPLVETVFDRLDTNALTAVTSPVTLAECLVAPYRSNETELRQVFADVIVSGSNTEFVPIDRTIADKAGELRARHNLTLTDAFQIATALNAGCDAFLTNDISLKRITDLEILVLEELES